MQDQLWFILAFAGIGLAIWVSRIYLRALVENYIENRFASERAREESSIRQIEARLSDLSTFALASADRKQSILQQRRMDAIDELWIESTKFAKFKFQLRMMQSLKIEKLAKAALKDPSIRKLAEIIAKTVDSGEFKNFSQIKARPYVSEPLWAAFNAYTMVMASSYGILTAISQGLPDAHKLFDGTS